MSVFGTITGIQTMPFPSSDSRFPVLQFVMSGAVSEDASGGIAQLFFVIRPTNQRASGLFYGIRSVYASGGNGSEPHHALAQRFVITQRQTRDEVISIPLVSILATADTISAAINVDTIIGRPTIEAAAAQIQVQGKNPNVGNFQALVYGFLWEPRAFAEGGPLWPGQFPTP